MSIQKISLPLLLASGALALTLDQAAQELIETHPGIKQKREEIKSAKSELISADAGYYPTIDLSAKGGKERSVSVFTANETRDLTTTTYEARLVQNIFSGFSTKSQSQKQEYALIASIYSMMSYANEAALELSQAYIGVIKADEILKTTYNNVKYYEGIYERVKLKTEHGQGRISDYYEISSRLTSAYATLLESDKNLKEAQEIFRKIYGQTKEPTELVKPVNKESMQIDQAISRALRNHPALRMKQSQILEAKQLNPLAKSGYYPHINLELSARNSENTSGIRGENDNYSALVTLNYNIFNGGADEAKVENALAQTQGAKESHALLRREIIQKNLIAHNAHESKKEQALLLTLSTKAMEQKQESYQKEFELGRRSLIELLDAQEDLFTVRLRKISNESELLLSGYRALEARGELLEHFGVAFSQQPEPLDKTASEQDELLVQTQKREYSFITPESLNIKEQEELKEQTKELSKESRPAAVKPNQKRSVSIEERLRELGITMPKNSNTKTSLKEGR